MNRIVTIRGWLKYLTLNHLKSIGDIQDFNINEELLPHVDSEGLNYVSKINISVIPKVMAKEIVVNIGFVSES